MMLTTDTQAILLLTAHFGKSTRGEPKLLTASEWGRFALWLKNAGLRPGDLLTGDLRESLRNWQDRHITVDRIQGLLDRGVALAVAVEKWQRAGVWVMTRSDADYPKRLKHRLDVQSPAVLFGAGNRQLLNAEGIAIVGSRKSSDADADFARALSQVAARSGLAVISGGARGIDEAAMLGALDVEGTAVGVLSDSLLRSAVSQKYRSAIQLQNLVLVSPFYPEAGFSAGNAMGRNKYIYCLSQAAVVVHSGKSGGTWNGAMENLQKRWVPLWVKSTEDQDAGNAELVQRGGQWSPENVLQAEMRSLLQAAEVMQQSHHPAPERISAGALVGSSGTQRANDHSSGQNPAEAHGAGMGASPEEACLDKSLYEIFCLKLGELLRQRPHLPKELQDALGLSQSQLKIWLEQAVQDGLIIKHSKPTRYGLARPQISPQLTIFGDLT